jgi:hypothetical protein
MPGFCLLPYLNTAVGVNASNTALTAVADQDFTQDGSGNFRFSEDYQLLAGALVGASVTKGRYQVPHWNALAEFDIFAANRAAGPPSNLFLDWYGLRPLPLPKFESFQVQVSGNLGAATEYDSWAGLFQAADGLWPLPQQGIPLRTTFTGSITTAVGGWQGPGAVTFAQALRGGVYSVIGCYMQLAAANADCFRLIFPRYRTYGTRKLRPGFWTQTAIGNVPNLQLQDLTGRLGEWGRFWTQEPFQVELLGRVAGATAFTGFIDLVYLGESQDLVQQGSGGGAAGYSHTASLAA